MDTGQCIEAAGATHVGIHRNHNEDSFAVVPELGLFIVADGVGGAASGEVASRMAVDLVRSFFEDDDPDATWPLGMDASKSRDEARLMLSLWRANRRIHDAARHGMTTRGMAATFAGIVADRERFCAAHVGDSRVYQFRNRRLELLTEDHSLRNDYRKRESCLGAPPLNLDGIDLDMLTRALGAEPSVEVETRVESAEPGNIVLVCSDGLTGPVPEEEIAGILSEAVELGTTTQRLIERAQDRGGRDDVTCILVRWKIAPFAVDRSPKRSPPRR